MLSCLFDFTFSAHFWISWAQPERIRLSKLKDLCLKKLSGEIFGKACVKFPKEGGIGP